MKLGREGIFWEDTAALSMSRHRRHHCRAAASVIKVLSPPLLSTANNKRRQEGNDAIVGNGRDGSLFLPLHDNESNDQGLACGQGNLFLAGTAAM